MGTIGRRNLIGSELNLNYLSLAITSAAFTYESRCGIAQFGDTLL